MRNRRLAVITNTSSDYLHYLQRQGVEVEIIRPHEDLRQYQHASGGFVEWDEGYRAAMRHEAGKGESSLHVRNGEPIVDLLYSNNWLPAAWARAYDADRLEVFGSPADVGWGPWSIESGWTVAEIASGLLMGLLEQRLLPFYEGGSGARMGVGLKLVAFGDSITAGQYVTERDTFVHNLAARFGFEAVNAGVPGHTTGQGLERLERDVIVHRPDVCVVAFGMNDHVMTAPDTAKTPLADFGGNLRCIVDRLRAEGIGVVLCTVNPVIEGDAEHYYYRRHPQEWYRNPDGAQARIDAYNDEIRRVAISLGVPIADVALRWQEHLAAGGRLQDLVRTIENSGTDDGVHPTAAGHDLFAACIGEVLVALLPALRGR